MGVSVTGVIAALICDLAFLKAVLGFFLGAIFFAASIVCQAVFINKAVFSVEDAGLEENVRSGFKRSVIRLAERSIGLTAAFLGFTLPLLLADANMGLALDSVLLWGKRGSRRIPAGLCGRAVFSACVVFAKGRICVVRKRNCRLLSEPQAEAQLRDRAGRYSGGDLRWTPVRHLDLGAIQHYERHDL